MLRAGRRGSETERSSADSSSEEEEREVGEESSGTDGGGLNLPILFADLTKSKYPVTRRCVKCVRLSALAVDM